MNAPSTSESTALAVATRHYDLSPRDFEEAWRMADYLANSDMVPKDFKGKPGNCLVAVQWGAELGLKTMQAIQNIAVINGRPSLWGDVMLALVRQSPLCEYVVESFEGSGDSLKAICKVKRRGEPEQVREFSCEDAKAANLLNKDGPWKQYRKRMLQMRARGWALRDVFTDVLKGLHMAEEAMDMPAPENFMGRADVVMPAGTPAAPAPPVTYSAEAFARNLPSWTKLIESKKKTADEVIATVETKAPLTEDQKKQLRAIQPKDAGNNQAQDVTPKVTYAAVAELIAKATEHAEVAAARALIPQVTDAQQQAELSLLATQREDELAF